MKKRVAILGAGATGLALAWKLLERTDIEIKIIEKEPVVGGIASGFEHSDLNFDFGSHKLHSSIPPEILKDLHDLLGNDLLIRPGNSRIYLNDRFVQIPLSFKNMLTSMPFSFLANTLKEALLKAFRTRKRTYNSYADLLSNAFSGKLCKACYFPYIEKLQGLNTRQITPLQIFQKNTKQYQEKLNQDILSLDLPVCKNSGWKKYYYPKHGFIQLFEEIMKRIWKKGGRFLLMQKFIQLTRACDGRLTCILEDGSKIDFDLVFSTIPLTHLINSIKQLYPENVTEIIHNPLEVPETVLQASKQINYRNIVLCYLILKTDQFTSYDTHYFPAQNILFSRISEPKNYSSSLVPNGKTGLCVEIPCSAKDDIWSLPDEDVIKRVITDLAKTGLPVSHLVIDTVVRHIEYAYPQYDLDIGNRFEVINAYLETIPDLIVLGQQDMVIHDFLHHSMETGYRAASCLGPDLHWDSGKWRFLSGRA